MLPRASALFLHRPWGLDRARLPKTMSVLSSHRTFDEQLTTGWNLLLAKKLKFQYETLVCLVGYKSEPERTIGLVGKLNVDQPLAEVQKTIAQEAGQAEAWSAESIDLTAKVRAICLMYAFGADEVRRAYESAVKAQFIDEGRFEQLIYVTGELREEGIQALKLSFPGMTALCVGHEKSVEFGLSLISQELQRSRKDYRVLLVLATEQKISN